MTGPQIGSLCTGYGGLDMATVDVFGGRVAWHCQWDSDDRHQYAARILAHHWPGVPNHGDITAVDWASAEPIDVVTAGFPCQDVSAAGLQAGIVEGNRSGLWFHVRRAVEALAPQWVVIENVEGLLSARADRGVGPTDPDVEAAGRDALRAIGCVLGDLADLGYDAEWLRLGASDVGATHRRYRIFVLAWPAHAAGPRLEDRRQGRPTRSAAADADRRSGGRREHLPEWSALERVASTGIGESRVEWGAAADAHGDALGEECDGEPQGCEGNDESRRVDPRGRVLDWRQFGPAVRRWERILGRPAPRPADDRGRLSPWFVEWMMGLPEGHVCSVPAAPGMSVAGVRNARLKALGNGVVPQQAAHALRRLLVRMDITP